MIFDSEDSLKMKPKFKQHNLNTSLDDNYEYKLYCKDNKKLEYFYHKPKIVQINNELLHLSE